MIGKLNMDPIDNVSRDSKDGTYRCPQCQTPFTRRSNLRRHFQIHLRGSSLKCEVCNEEHSTKDSLQDHVTNSHSSPWNVSYEKPVPNISPFGSVSPPSYGPFSSTSGQYPSLVSPVPARAFQVPNFGRLSVSTTGSSMLGSPPMQNSFSHRRSNTSSSSISSSPVAPSSSPYTRQPQGHYGFYAPPEAPALFTHQEWITEIMGQERGGGNGGDEQPIYTRQQVKNMLDAVSDCFVESVESFLNNGSQRPLNIGRTNQYSMVLDTGVRQMILNEAIPRLVSRAQGGDDVNVMSSSTGRGY